MGDSGSAWSGVRARARVRGYTPVRGVAVDRAGVLLEGREDLTGTPVLIRILSPALAADHAFMRGARHAWERLRELRHANLVSIITFDATAGAVVEEFLDGTTLAHLMEVQGPVELNGALAMFDACLAGLDALHAAHLCHSDVRPESVVISVSGVVMLRDTAIPVPPLHAGWRAGTPQYMAPELWAGHAHSPATDVYAATAVLFESITGRPPFPGTELGALRYGHERSPLRVDAVPAVARPLLLAGMAKEARDRPSAARLRRDLDQAARGYLGDSWRENGRAWLAGAAASRAGDPLPVLADPAGDGDEEDFLPELTGATQRSGDGRRWRVLAGVATAVATLLVVVVVAARALTGPATSPAPTAPGLPLFGGSPSASVAPTQVSVSATPLESETAVSTSTPQPTAPTPRPTSDQTISFAPVSTPTPTATPSATPTPTPTCRVTPPKC